MLNVITWFFVASLLISNILSTKIINLNGVVFDGWTILFPLSYILADILTEIYGFKNAKKVIWIGFWASLLLSFCIYIVWILPSDPSWWFQNSYQNILMYSPRLVFASLIAYLVGEIINSFIMSKMKERNKNWKLYQRTIASTIIGQIFDTTIFSVLAFYWTIPNNILINLIVSVYIMKVAIEVLFTPITYFVINKLKKIENF